MSGPFLAAEAEYGDAYAYFPNDALVSLLCVIDDGKAAEIGVVGNDGMVGIEGMIGGRNPYVQAKVQCAGTAICYRHHSIEQQLCRKLLTSSDHLCSDELALTQSMIADLLGVRREGRVEPGRYGVILETQARRVFGTATIVVNP